MPSRPALSPHAAALAEAIARAEFCQTDLTGLAFVIREESKLREQERAVAAAGVVSPGMRCRLRNVSPSAFNGALVEVVEVHGTRVSVRIEGEGVLTVSCASLVDLQGHE